MKLSIKGKITTIEELQILKDDFRKRIFTIETSGDYPKTIAFQLIQDKVNLTDNLHEDEYVEVFFNLESREFNGKYYHNVTAWKIEPHIKEDTTKVHEAKPIENESVPF